MPTYVELAQHYNANLENLDRLWASAVVEMTWQDHNHHRWEQGDGHLILVMPDHVSLSIGKLGNTLLWAGSDSERFWLFDLQDDKTAYVGHHATVGLPGVDELPVPIRPLQLVRLLGIVPFSTEPDGAWPRVQWLNGQYLVEPQGMDTRMLVDPKTYLPTRIDLLDDKGVTVAIAKLSRPGTVEMSPQPPTPGAGLPRMNTRFEITVPGREGGMVLFLTRLTDGRVAGKIDPQIFDYDVLFKKLKVSREIVLDKDYKPSPPGE